MKIRAVLFDATGVLIAPGRPVGETYARLAAAHGVELSAWRLDDAFRRVVQRAEPRVFPGCRGEETARRERAWWREIVRQTFQAADSTVRPSDFRAGFDAFFDALYRTYGRADAWQLTPGAADALAAIRSAGRATGVVSNFDHRLPDLLEALGIAGLLETIQIPARCGAAKPDPAIFEAALSALSLPAQEAVYVGHDPVDDALAARQAGLVPLLWPEGEPLGGLPARIEALATLTDRG